MPVPVPAERERLTERDDAIEAAAAQRAGEVLQIAGTEAEARHRLVLARHEVDKRVEVLERRLEEQSRAWVRAVECLEACESEYGELVTEPPQLRDRPVDDGAIGKRLLGQD